MSKWADSVLEIDDIYDYLRFTKYNIGNSMVRHQDGKFYNINYNNNKYNSNYTLIIFLSNVEGGELKIYNNDNEYYYIKPKKGAICIINQNTEHEALPVLKGIKYNIRTDLLKLNKCENEYTSRELILDNNSSVCKVCISNSKNYGTLEKATQPNITSLA
jgi:predicted 2-oxoglutarate/Fe(II)-dependent dioxygenase YbiX